MTIEEKRTLFQGKADAFDEKAKSIKKVSKTLSWSRVILFLLFIISVVYLVNDREFYGAILTVIGFIPVFGLLINKHNKVNFDLKQHQFLVEINHNETSRLDGNLSHIDQGNQFEDQSHPYAPDLDLFGSNSLFQLLNRTSFSGVKKRLALWLKASATHTEIPQRQEAIKELSQNIDWSQELIALSRHHEVKDIEQSEINEIAVWLKKDTNSFKKPIWMVLQVLILVNSMTTIVGYFAYDWMGHWIILSIAANTLILKYAFVPLLGLTKSLSHVSQLLKSYELVIAKIEEKHFESPLLKTYQKQLIGNNFSVSKALSKLRLLIQFLFNRANVTYLPLNSLLGLDLFIIKGILRWNSKHADQISNWIDSTDKICSLVDMSCFAVNQTSFYPTINEKEIILDIEDLGHPLIPHTQRIYNTMNTNGKGKLALITGSNMSGKSTFLRTLGVNLVLAQMGAPVLAKKFEWSLVNIFTSMRTQDNLEENVSSFYAELKRIKQLLDSINEGQPTFYMLDEILKGTNSVDRHKGAISLINQLCQSNTIGLISTHDIELAELSNQNTSLINYSFNSTIVEDEIIFDYKLTNGPCKSFNASKLMEKMGIIKN